MNQDPTDNKPMVDNKVIPVMREAVTAVQMVLFKVLRQSVHDACCPDRGLPHPIEGRGDHNLSEPSPWMSGGGLWRRQPRMVSAKCATSGFDPGPDSFSPMP
jgi:hypothetical protein